MNAQEAANGAIEYLVRRVNGIGGIIVIDRNGNWGSGCSAPGMLHGIVTQDTLTVLSDKAF